MICLFIELPTSNSQRYRADAHTLHLHGHSNQTATRLRKLNPVSDPKKRFAAGRMWRMSAEFPRVDLSTLFHPVGRAPRNGVSPQPGES